MIFTFLVSIASSLPAESTAVSIAALSFPTTCTGFLLSIFFGFSDENTFIIKDFIKSNDEAAVMPVNIINDMMNRPVITIEVPVVPKTLTII
ncbi:hypothetical protein SDC9_135222 [bioreactor metagenome]|uniref:Uncharacterized protein n=1 Tax=bioreactor metagenome TaxID=1076179 RepID=A0A645DFV1_9ZZZZ